MLAASFAAAFEDCRETQTCQDAHSIGEVTTCEVKFRTGRQFEKDDESLRQIIMILKKPNGIYKHTSLDNRIYDIREAIKLNTNSNVLCVLVNSFVLKCKLNRKYSRSAVDPKDDTFRASMFVFLVNVKNCLDTTAEKLIDLEMKRVDSFDLTIRQKVESIVAKNALRINPAEDCKLSPTLTSGARWQPFIVWTLCGVRLENANEFVVSHGMISCISRS